MKLLLVSTNQFREPLGPVLPLALEYLAQAASGAGHEVKVIDLCFHKDSELFELVGDFAPEAVGLSVRNTYDGSTMTDFLPRVRDIVNSMRSRGYRNIIVGGNGISGLARQCFDYLQPDFAVVGEGEFPLVEILDGIKRGATSYETPGVIYRRDGQVVENPLIALGPKRPYWDINKLPPLSRTFVDSMKYQRWAGMANIQTKRGCPMQCSYCVTPNTQGRQVRVFEPSRIADEFEQLAQQGVKHLYVTDAEFNLPPKAAMELCEELIRRNNKLGWTCDVRPVNNALPSELIEAMAKAGCLEVNMTVDTGNEKVAKKNHLSQTREGVIDATLAFKKFGIYIIHAYVVGLPGQGPEELRETLEMLDACKPNYTFFYVEPWIYPHTPLEQIAIAEGRLKPDWSPLELTYYRSEHADELLRMIKAYAKRFSPAEIGVLAPGDSPPFGAFMSQMVGENGYYGPFNKMMAQVNEHKFAMVSMIMRYLMGRLRDKMFGAPVRKL
ncbi:MAG TPA: radical SAM protein [Myxococcaceae bacterium]|jgi:radical SAM superfamily enzyme YgiQ (UPF0313 family)